MLKRSLCLTLCAAALLAADKPAKARREDPKPQRKAEAAAEEKGRTPFGVFKGAANPSPEAQPEAGSRKTPFGEFKNAPDPQRGAPAPVQAAPGLRVAGESADTVTFERKSPFGPSRWQRKKSELSAEERAAWERSKAPAADGGTERE